MLSLNPFTDFAQTALDHELRGSLGNLTVPGSRGAGKVPLAPALAATPFPAAPFLRQGVVNAKPFFAARKLTAQAKKVAGPIRRAEKLALTATQNVKTANFDMGRALREQMQPQTLKAKQKSLEGVLAAE